MEKKNVPYVYFVKNKTTNLKYIGVRYSKNCKPDDFWVKYFTSSKLVHKLIKIYGVDDFKFKIIKTFDDNHDALLYENKLINLIIERDDYLNIWHDGLIKDKDEYYLNQEKKKKLLVFYGKLQYCEKIGLHGIDKDRKIEISSVGGKNAAIVNKKNKTGIFNPEVRERQHKTLREKQISAFYDPKIKSSICKNGGNNGAFSKNYYLKNNLTEEDRIEKQRSRGKIGGKKNKGFVNCSFKLEQT